ncbi:IPP-5 protein [Aphelenchoides avenae]|nr:IPP-5 protein [Aphelenchus avenae]
MPESATVRNTLVHRFMVKMPELLLITSNVGSLFDEKPQTRKAWLTRVAKAIRIRSPAFVMLHMQETGGKNFKLYTKDVPSVVEELHRHLLPDYKHCRAFLDLDYECLEEYTALGAVAFVHRNHVAQVRQYHFGKGKFVSIDNDPFVLQDDVNDCDFVRKEKFPLSFNPTPRWGRKGYLHTRWQIFNKVVDLVNVHLFHDESNILCHEDPALYSSYRKKALDYTLERYSEFRKPDDNGSLFIFGDFNFRLNPDSFLRKITESAKRRELESDQGKYETHRCSSDDSDISLNSDNNNMLEAHQPLRRQVSAIEYRASDLTPGMLCKNGCILRIEKKRFDYLNKNRFIDDWKKFREDDRESVEFALKEVEIAFPPTYPWSEDPQRHFELMNTRAPAWCDRVLMNEEAWRLVSADESRTYTSLGMDACVGDHKPVMLSFSCGS